MQRKYILPIGLVLSVVILWFAFGGDKDETTELFTTPRKGEFIVEVTSTGELRAKNSTEIKGPQGAREFRINNIKIQRMIPEGTLVKEGDFVAELDRSQVLAKMQDAQLEVDQAQSQVTQAQLDSTLTLSQARDNLINLEYALEERQIAVDQSRYESPAVQRQAEIELDKAKRTLSQEKKNYITKVKQAEAKISEIEAELTKKKNELNKIRALMGEFTVYAPDQGMLIYKRNWNGSKVTVGEEISAWNPIVAELPDFTVMESLTYVNEIDIQKLKEGQDVIIGLDAVQGKILDGTVTSVANIGEQRPNSDSKVYEVIIEVAGTDSLLRPAMTTSNRIQVSKLNDVLSVPLETIHAVDSLSFVFVKDGLSAKMQQVELGLINENEAVIHRGITIDDRLYLSMPADTSGIQRSYLIEELSSSN
ncbi:efflux RND transporter periplasmic adaptor subunit [Balneola vulgaris]|uniref:efflux RND transporter periplasmic adaptor subunit n=1 Tax=Balneola vulgaris TaxID=287535 RepID=UPI0003811333|nr:HlyD family efflux transporter periplasmic adaptor subunit [Balneola vulgaris]